MVIPYHGTALVADLMLAVEKNLSVPGDCQRLIFRGQNLHERRDQPLSVFGIYNSSVIRLVGRKVFIIDH